MVLITFLSSASKTTPFIMNNLHILDQKSKREIFKLFINVMNVFHHLTSSNGEACSHLALAGKKTAK